MAGFAWSESALSQIEECPKAWSFKKMKKLVPDLPRILTVGSQAHEAIEKYVLACMELRLPSDPSIIPSIIRDLVDEKTKGPIEEDLRDEVETILDRFASLFAVDFSNAVVEGLVAFDREWNRVEWYGPTVRFRMKMDLVEVIDQGATVRIRDWKTGWGYDSQAEAESKPQLRSYAFGASLLYPKAKNFIVSYEYVRRGWSTEFEITREEARAWRETLEDRMAKADDLAMSKSLRARPGPNCESCFYRRFCDAYRDAGRTEIPDDLTELVDLWSLLKARQKDVDAKLRALIEVNGPVELPGGKSLAFHGTEGIRFDEKKPLVEELLGMGVSASVVWDKISITKDSVEKILRAGLPNRKPKERKEIASGLAARFGVKTRSTRFMAKKVKREDVR